MGFAIQKNKYDTILTLYHGTELKEGFLEFLTKELGTNCSKTTNFNKDIGIRIDGPFSYDYITKLFYTFYPLTLNDIKNKTECFLLTYDFNELTKYNLNPRHRGSDGHLVITVGDIDYKVGISFTPE